MQYNYFASLTFPVVFDDLVIQFLSWSIHAFLPPVYLTLYRFLEEILAVHRNCIVTCYPNVAGSAVRVGVCDLLDTIDLSNIKFSLANLYKITQQRICVWSYLIQDLVVLYTFIFHTLLASLSAASFKRTLSLDFLLLKLWLNLCSCSRC